MIRKRKPLLFNPKPNGFMITEVLITMLLIVITMISIVPMFVVGIKTSKVSKNRTVEMKIAQEEIERFNQDKFSTAYDFIRNSYIATCNSDPDPNCFRIKFEEGFKKEKKSDGTYNESSENTSFVNDRLLYINPANGSVTPAEGSMPQGSQLVRVRRTYTYIKGQETKLDDAIQITVNVQVTGQNNRPVSLTSVVSVDKIQ